MTWKSSIVPWQQCDRERRVLLEKAWEIGELSYKFTPSQLDLHQRIRKWEKKQGHGRTFAIDISRRWGKSQLGTVLEIEDAVRHTGWRIIYCAPQYKMVTKIVRPLMEWALQDCPPGLRPEWVKSEGTYYYRNGSKIELVGLDENPDGARGTGIDKVFLDEAAFCDNLEYLLTSILYPQMLGRSHARIIAASTPPVSPSHFWSSALVPEAIMQEAHDKRTLLDADQYSDEEKEEFIRAAGGRRSTACRREYFAEHVTDDTMAIIPEFREVEADVVKAMEPPVWRDCYVSMDPGWKDLTAVLFGYWNFEERCLFIEDELAAPRLNSDAVAAAIKDKELVLWHRSKRKGYNDDLKPQPFLRVSDNDPRLLYDLSTEHGLAFAATAKDNLDQQINALRVAVQNKRVRIHPRCRKLIAHLKNGVWKNEARKVFATEGGDLGHFDLIAALVYMWRNVQQHRNPAPKAERYVAGDIRIKEGKAGGSKWQGKPGESKFYRRGNRFYVRTK